MMYRWRTLTDEERRRALCARQEGKRPVHSLFHFDNGRSHYLITSACFNHEAYIGHSVERMNAFTQSWLETLHEHSVRVVSWVVLPNHYHALLCTEYVLKLLKALGRLHGRTSFHWNGEENARGRQVWHNAAETVIKSTGHFNATINYVHHNPVKHRYVAKWTEWPWSSAADYLNEVGHEEAQRIWRAHPIDS
jgi:putative transposase